VKGARDDQGKGNRFGWRRHFVKEPTTFSTTATDWQKTPFSFNVEDGTWTLDWGAETQGPTCLRLQDGNGPVLKIPIAGVSHNGTNVVLTYRVAYWNDKPETLTIWARSKTGKEAKVINGYLNVTDPTQEAEPQPTRPDPASWNDWPLGEPP
jgi:hypothetical protein